jgi:hypothetical protein
VLCKRHGRQPQELHHAKGLFSAPRPPRCRCQSRTPRVMCSHPSCLPDSDDGVRVPVCEVGGVRVTKGLLVATALPLLHLPLLHIPVRAHTCALPLLHPSVEDE